MGRIVGYLVPKKPAEKKQEAEKPVMDTTAVDTTVVESPAPRKSKKKVQDDA